MLDTDRKYPLGATRIGFWLYLGLLVAGLVALLVIDIPVAALAAAVLAPTRPFFEIVTIPGNSVWTLVPALVVAALAFVLGRLLSKGLRRAQAMRIAALATFVFAGVGLPGLVAAILKRVIGRARPYRLDELGAFSFQPLNGGDFVSFPSGDTTTVFAGAAIVLFFFPRFGWLAVIGAAAVGFARIALSMHFPSDVYGGILLGTFGAYAVRNFCEHRGWLFMKTADGRIVPKPFPLMEHSAS